MRGRRAVERVAQRSRAGDGRRQPIREEGPVTRRLSARFVTPLRHRMHGSHTAADTGAASAEYAVVTVAAAGLGGVLIKLLTSDWFLEIIKSILTWVLKAALSFFGLG
jgi:hypothetical protein